MRFTSGELRLLMTGGDPTPMEAYVSRAQLDRFEMGPMPDKDNSVFENVCNVKLKEPERVKKRSRDDTPDHEDGDINEMTFRRCGKVPRV